ncbi:PDZ domain-containing protein [uncultured Gammaproteobacteria bacterium]
MASLYFLTLLRQSHNAESSVGVKQETQISVTILTVVTAVVIGVWTNGFGLFKHVSAVNPSGVMSAVWGGGKSSTADGISGAVPPVPGTLLMLPVNAVNGFPPHVIVQPPPVAEAVPVAVPSAGPVQGQGMVEGAVEAVAPKAPNFIPETVQLYEAHWQGMDVRLLTVELRRKLRFPQQLEGILVGEVSLAAGRSGLLGGDVIVAIQGQPVMTLEAFQEATRTVANHKQATMAVLRKVGARDQTGARSTMMRLTLALSDSRELGFAQVEGAPMIKAGDPRPHPDRGPCTQCHSIGSGFELRPDPDLITLPPPPLFRDTVAQGVRPHEDRGPCQACHVIAP